MPVGIKEIVTNSYYRKKNRSPEGLLFKYYPKITNYAATAGATRATGRDSPAARSRGKL